MLIAKPLYRRVAQLSFILSDFLFLTLCLWLIRTFRFNEGASLDSLLLFFKDINFWVIQLSVLLGMYIFDLHEPRWWRVAIASRARLLLAYFFSAALALSWLYLSAQPIENLFGRGVFLGSLTLFLLPAWLVRLAYFTSQINQSGQNNWLIISSLKANNRLQNELKTKNVMGQWQWVNAEVVSQNTDSLLSYMSKNWTGILVEGDISPKLSSLLMKWRFSGSRIMGLNTFYENYWGKVPVESIDHNWFTFEEGFSLFEGRINRRFKRIFDLSVSVSLLILSSPIWILLYILIPLESRGPIIYKQVRVGMDGREFRIYKFRSMRSDSEKNGAQWAQKNDSRVTFLGKIMRPTRLDELPQLWNILNGKMSFVGPRPERPEFTKELEKDIPFYQLRHLVKPGLTGWAQVMYPYGASIEDARQKLEYDLYYIKNYSLRLDLQIAFKTISVVLFGAGR